MRGEGRDHIQRATSLHSLLPLPVSLSLSFTKILTTWVDATVLVGLPHYLLRALRCHGPHLSISCLI